MRHLSKAEALALVAEEAAGLEERFAGCAMCGAIAAISEGAAPADLGESSTCLGQGSPDACRHATPGACAGNEGVQQASEGLSTAGTTFCHPPEERSVEASIRCAVLAQNEVAVAMLDRFAARPGHVVVVLRRHAETIAGLPWEEYAAVQRLAWEASRALTTVLAPVRVYVAALGATRRIATSFPHHHVHVIPLMDGGENDRPASVLTWAHGIHVYEAGELVTWSERLRAAWPR